MYVNLNESLFDQISRSMNYVLRNARRTVDGRFEKLTKPAEKGEWWTVASEVQWHADDLSNECTLLRSAETICQWLEKIALEGYYAEGKVFIAYGEWDGGRVEFDNGWFDAEVRKLQVRILAQYFNGMSRGVTSGSMRSEMESRSDWLAHKAAIEWVGINEYELGELAAEDILAGIARRNYEQQAAERKIIRIIEVRKEGNVFKIYGWNNMKSVIRHWDADGITRKSDAVNYARNIGATIGKTQGVGPLIVTERPH